MGLFLKKYKAIDSQWSPPEKKQQYLNAYSVESWQKTAQGKKTLHQVEECKCCLLTTPVQSSLFEKSTSCVASKREAFTEVKSREKELSGKKIFKPTQKEVKNVESVIYKEFDSVCKERLGKSFGEVMSMVPEAGLTKKVSPVEAKKNP